VASGFLPVVMNPHAPALKSLVARVSHCLLEVEGESRWCGGCGRHLARLLPPGLGGLGCWRKAEVVAKSVAVRLFGRFVVRNVAEDGALFGHASGLSESGCVGQFPTVRALLSQVVDGLAEGLNSYNRTTI